MKKILSRLKPDLSSRSLAVLDMFDDLNSGSLPLKDAGMLELNLLLLENTAKYMRKEIKKQRKASNE